MLKFIAYMSFVIVMIGQETTSIHLGLDKINYTYHEEKDIRYQQKEESHDRFALNLGYLDRSENTAFGFQLKFGMHSKKEYKTINSDFWWIEIKPEFRYFFEGNTANIYVNTGVSIAYEKVKKPSLILNSGSNNPSAFYNNFDYGFIGAFVGLGFMSEISNKLFIEPNYSYTLSYNIIVSIQKLVSKQSLSVNLVYVLD